MGFFRKEDAKEEKITEVIDENMKISKNDDKSAIKRKNLSVCDVDTIQYVIKNFPSMSIEIQKGLLNLSDILEKTIDHIEDKSSEEIKEHRDFKLSQSYRDISISVYKMVQNIQEYVLWMNDEYNKVKIEENKIDSEKSLKEKDKKEKLSESNNNVKYLEKKDAIEIYNDFTGKEPEAFILDEEIVEVEDWNDLLVKAAEVLNKKYKENKHSNKTVKEYKIVDVKSTQNEFRNTAIEMLNEYKIDLSEFEIIER